MSFEFVNVIGYGYVGGAMGHLCKTSGMPFCVYDTVKKDANGANTLFDTLFNLIKHSELHNETNVYFVAVPTPSTPGSGKCDTSIVETVVRDISNISAKNTVVYIKSTVQPGTCRKLCRNVPSHVTLVFCPEFLREKTYLDDIVNSKFVLLGTEMGSIPEVYNELWHKLYNPKIKIVMATFEEAELFKTVLNSYLAVKVWYFNKVYNVCQELSVDYNSLHKLFELDPRIGASHTQVPGHTPAGSLGFGGSCLPKETQSFSYIQEQLGIDNQVIEHILYENNQWRKGT
ncbi:MAG: UDP-glucose/GDP-mannose dehydrogenase family protein [Proteobacteria bacterium]|nr:UDP-glucose/GDP-mannose dehydrogenase family protein [Pseudomonadota bacterium]NBP14652.1 UDP-glucose/GDP-mannose dehydrogenase family protein [bacterium]